MRYADFEEDFTRRLHPDDLVRVTEALEHAVATCGAFDAEYRVVLPGGATRWVQGRGRALGDVRGVAVRLLGAAYDTTDQRHGDARVARVLETMSAAFYALDPQWRFSYVNAEAERLLGRRREDLLGGLLWDLFPGAVHRGNHRLECLRAIGKQHWRWTFVHCPAVDELHQLAEREIAHAVGESPRRAPGAVHAHFPWWP